MLVLVSYTEMEIIKSVLRSPVGRSLHLLLLNFHSSCCARSRGGIEQHGSNCSLLLKLVEIVVFLVGRH